LLRGYCASTLTWTRKLSGKQSSIGITVNIEDEPYVKVNYTITDCYTDEKTDYDYKINLTTTPCHFGGVRYWFICPLSTNGVYCGRRTGTLYLASGGKYFGCRHCYNLSYESRNEPHFARRGGLYYPLKLDSQIEKLCSQINRRTYKGRPTKKARKLQVIKKLGNVPSKDELDRLLRYEGAIERQFYKAMNQLERLQRMRSGESVPAPIEVEVGVDTGQNG
jgi:hypothetical protein